MTVVCPACNARFRDPPADVPLTRPLQCSACEHEWVRSDVPRITLDAPSLAPDMADLIGDNAPIKTALPVLVPGETVRDHAVDVVPERKRRAAIFVDREVPAKARRSFAKPLLAVCCLMVAAGALALVERARLIDLVPQSAPVFAALGLPAPSNGLALADIQSTRTQSDGIRRLIVRGKIQNHAETSMTVPPIQLTVRGEGDTELYAWTVAASQKNLAPGKTGRFTAIAVDYPADAVDVEVVFAPDRAQMAKP